MATHTTIKPFGPEEAQMILDSLKQPAVFLNMTCDWPVLHWTLDRLSVLLGDKAIRFRLGRIDETNTPLFETQCSYLEAKLAQFVSWASGESGADVGPFSDYLYSEYWAYADYKYIAMLFQDQPSMFEDVMWSGFGFKGRDGKQSTLWIGTEGANTPCHLDSYGYNLVLQVQGRKRWHLFPPEDTANLYPTRIPYEESSIFSQVDVLQPDLRRFPAFRRARAHTVTLLPGQEVDDEARVSEALTKAVVCALKTTPSNDNADAWLNPTEEGVACHDENMQYVNLAVRTCMERERGQHHCKQTHEPRRTHPVKRDSSGQAKESTGESTSFTVPFGPYLIPVHCEQKDWQEIGEMTPKDPDFKSSRNPLVQHPIDCTVNPDAPQSSRPMSDGGLQHVTHECSSAPGQCTSYTCGNRISQRTAEDGETEDLGHTPITTNDLLDCLVHPDVIDRVTELLLERQRGGHRSGGHRTGGHRTGGHRTPTAS
ncbi:HSPB1-associated protein 1 homolog isoform 2-T2 [Polymixia lowei]